MRRTLAAMPACCLVLLLLQMGCAQDPGGRFAELPARFVGDRIFVRPVTLGGDTLNLYTDSGGSILLSSEVVDRLGLKTERVVTGGDMVTSMPTFKRGASIPAFAPLPEADPLSVLKGRVFVFPEPDSGPYVGVFGDGMLGQVWFAGRRDASFHTYMAQFMDRPVEGALGGSLFRYFRITVDYPQGVAMFEMAE